MKDEAELPPMRLDQVRICINAVAALVPVVEATREYASRDAHANFVLENLRDHVPPWEAAPILAKALTDLLEHSLKASVERSQEVGNTP